MLKKLYLSPNGRCSRKFYWIFGIFLPYLVLGAALSLVDNLDWSHESRRATMLLFVWPMLAMQIKRWHDIGFPGWFVLLILIPPIIGVPEMIIEFTPLIIGLPGIIIGFIPGNSGTNSFGPDPLGRKISEKKLCTEQHYALEKVVISDQQFSTLKKLPEENSSLSYSRLFSSDEFEKISEGVISNSMDEKWNMYFYKNTLYMYRSWTGTCIYTVSFEEKDNGYAVGQTLVNRDKEQYRETDDEYDALLIDFLISNLSLGDCLPFPIKADNTETPGVVQHSVSGTGYSEVQVKTKP